MEKETEKQETNEEDTTLIGRLHKGKLSELKVELEKKIAQKIGEKIATKQQEIIDQVTGR